MKSRLRGGAAGDGIVGPGLILRGEGPVLAGDSVICSLAIHHQCHSED